MEGLLTLVVSELSSYGLTLSCRWAAELLGSCNSKSGKLHQLDEQYKQTPTDGDDKQLLLAKAYFDSKEYSRASFVLRESQGRKAFFIRNYSLFLSGEKRKEEDLIDSAGKYYNVKIEIVSI
jgi:anaphase-promoting complex subunit 8